MNQWISVKERLPQHMRPVFCCNADSGRKWVGFSRSGMWLSDGPDATERIELRVTHWMECEPPPKPDPFDEWWFLRRGDIVGSLMRDPRQTAKLIWDAAVASVRQ